MSGAGSGPEGATAAWGVHVVIAPPKLYMTLRSYWQHVGDGISSRQAQYFLAALDNGNSSICPSSDFEPGGPFASNLLYSAESKEKEIIRELVADSFSKDGAAVVGKRDVFLFPSGMKAIYEVWRVLLDLKEASDAEVLQPLTLIELGPVDLRGEIGSCGIWFQLRRHLQNHRLLLPIVHLSQYARLR